MREIRLLLVAVALLVLLPSVARGQASMTGAVKDTSGAVLPGVTVEAVSPVLIEKVRTATTDGTGQYRIVDLRPGTYTLTFSLPGFNTIKREGVELTGSFTASIDAEMRVGALEETITVTGETPIVDVQSATRQRVIDRELVEALPANRVYYTLPALIPGMNSSSQDVGGSTGSQQANSLRIHGGRSTDQRITQNGVGLNTLVGGQWGFGGALNSAGVQETAVDYAGADASIAQGGVTINLIPRDGGNKFQGQLYLDRVTSGMQGSNLTQELRDRGLSTPDSIKSLYDINPAFGGPIARDKLWFYATGRYNGAANYVAGMYHNLNANNPNAWTYVADPSRPASNDHEWTDNQVRLTWQATQKNKVGMQFSRQTQCLCPSTISATMAPETARRWRYPLQYRAVADYSSPVTNRVLMEGAAIYQASRYDHDIPLDLNRAMIPVTEQSTGLTYRARQNYQDNWTNNIYYRIAASYIPGGHAFKVGFNNGSGRIWSRPFATSPLLYRFNNGVPNQITMRAWPYVFEDRMDAEGGLFAQDRWSMSNRVTVTLGVRYDFYRNSFPEQHLGPTELTPGRELTLPGRDNLSWNDVTPRGALSYDVFGDGKTAVKVTLNKYLEGLGLAGLATGPNPANTLVTQTTRSWSDVNGNFVPDCTLLNPLANGECGAMADAAFGSTRLGATYDPELMRGWGKRGYNWEFSAGVQREIAPRVSAEVSYFRRSYGNFVVTDNLTVSPADYNPFSITAPRDPRLPDGGGYVISGLYDLNPARFGQPANNFVTQASKYGEQTEHWNGMDAGVSARTEFGLRLQGGLSTGRATRDNCDVATRLDNPSPLYCHVQEQFLTQVKGLATYTIPRIDVMASGTFQSLPGPETLANYNAPNALVVPSLGRNLSGAAANVTVNLVSPGSVYGERINQLDLRAAKILRFGRTRTAVNFDLYNALNSSAVLAQNSNFAIWQRPSSILTARFYKVSVLFDF